MSVATCGIVGVCVGACSKHRNRQLWTSLLGIYRQCAVAYTDFWDVYGCVLLNKRYSLATPLVVQES